MNRQIKFRAWDKEKGYMVDPCAGYLIEFDGDCWYNLGTEDLKDNLLNQTEILVLMQFTGLKDCNGVEIYEGDIFCAPHDFGPGGFSVRTSSVPTDHYMDIQWQYWNLDELKVIGNIYENPDLLTP